MSEKITLPAGAYWVCDPCYAIPKDRWEEWLKIAGLHDAEEMPQILSGALDGKMCIGIGTAYGDGVYYDQYGGEYGVDSGLIGLVPKEIADQNLDDEIFHVFWEDIECYFNGDTGEIVLGHIVIQTGDNPDDEEDEEDDEEEYDSAW